MIISILSLFFVFAHCKLNMSFTCKAVDESHYNYRYIYDVTLTYSGYDTTTQMSFPYGLQFSVLPEECTAPGKFCNSAAKCSVDSPKSIPNEYSSRVSQRYTTNDILGNYITLLVTVHPTYHSPCTFKDSGYQSKDYLKVIRLSCIDYHMNVPTTPDPDTWKPTTDRNPNKNLPYLTFLIIPLLMFILIAACVLKQCRNSEYATTNRNNGGGSPLDTQPTTTRPIATNYNYPVMLHDVTSNFPASQQVQIFPEYPMSVAQSNVNTGVVDYTQTLTPVYTQTYSQPGYTQ